MTAIRTGLSWSVMPGAQCRIVSRAHAKPWLATASLVTGVLIMGFTAQAQTLPASPARPASSATSARADNALPAISVREAYERAKSGTLVLVDIRTPEEWTDTGVPTDALRLDMREPTFEAKLAGLRASNPGKEIALICRTANRTTHVQNILSARGWTGLINVKGGLLGNPTDKGWLDEGLPVAQTK